MQLKKDSGTFPTPPVVPTVGAGSSVTTASRRHSLATAELYSFGRYKTWVQKIKGEWR
jgi:hypothetical protein